jgi:hypothetical protein
MSMIKELAAEFIGMFFGDARLAAAVIALVAATAALVGPLQSSAFVGGLVLLGGCLVILIESVRHAAKPRVPR